MAKIEVNALPLPDKVVETHTFTDPLAPNVPLTVMFEVEPDYGLFLHAQSLGQKYVTERTGKKAVPIGVGNTRKAVKPSPEICRQIAVIQSLEVGDMEDRYAFEEWFALSMVLPNAFAAVVAKCDDLIAKAFGQLADGDEIPNDSADPEPPISGQPSNTTEETTPTSLPGSPPVPPSSQEYSDILQTNSVLTPINFPQQ